MGVMFRDVEVLAGRINVPAREGAPVGVIGIHGAVAPAALAQRREEALVPLHSASVAKTPGSIIGRTP